MDRTKSARFLFLTLALVATACDTTGNKIGSTVKGERIAIMEQTKAPEADKDLSSSKPSLPSHMMVNMSWPQAGYDSEHDLPYLEVAPHPHILWTTSIGEGSTSDFKLLAHPVVDRGLIFNLDAQGLVRAIDVRSGAMVWEYDTTPKGSDEKAIAGGLAVDGETLFVTSGFGDVFALSSKDGKIKWKKSLLKPFRAAPTVADNRVYVVSIDNQLNALNAQTGEVIWHQEGIAESATLMGASSPAVAGDSVIVTYNSGEIFQLRAQNGRAAWNYSLAAATQAGALPAIADIRGLPVVDHGRVFAISHSGRMAAIDQRSGERVWENDVGGIDTPVVAGDTLFVYGGDGQLMAIARDTGRILWVKALQKHVDPDDKSSDRIVWTGPLLAGERLWLVNSQGALVSFSPKDGALMDTIDLGAPIYLTPIVVDHTFYVTADDGSLIALR